MRWGLGTPFQRRPIPRQRFSSTAQMGVVGRGAFLAVKAEQTFVKTHQRFERFPIFTTFLSARLTKLFTKARRGAKVTQRYLIEFWVFLGRLWKTRANDESTIVTMSGNEGIWTLQGDAYGSANNVVNRYTVTSNPFSSPGGAGMGWSRTKYDQEGRAVESASFDRVAGATTTTPGLPPPWGANGTSLGASSAAYSNDTVTKRTRQARRARQYPTGKAAPRARVKARVPPRIFTLG